jgi:hypothetical protein
VSEPESPLEVKDETLDKELLIQHVKETEPCKFNEQTCLNFEQFALSLRFTEGEDQVLKETVVIDVSSLLWRPRPNLESTSLVKDWTLTEFKSPELQQIHIKIEATNQLLSDYLHRKLNPTLVTLHAFKQLPIAREWTVGFINFFGDCCQTIQQTACETLRLNHEHCVLMGKHDVLHIREQLQVSKARVLISQSPTGEPTGTALFCLRDLLRPHCLELKLRSDLLPFKPLNFLEDHNLNLNESARKLPKGLQGIHPYLEAQSFCILSVKMSYRLDKFEEPTQPPKDLISARELCQS